MLTLSCDVVIKYISMIDCLLIHFQICMVIGAFMLLHTYAMASGG